MYSSCTSIFRSLNATNSSQQPYSSRFIPSSPHYSVFGLPSLSWSCLSKRKKNQTPIAHVQKLRSFVLAKGGRETYTFLSNSSNSFLCAAILAFKARSLTVTTTHVSPKISFKLPLKSLTMTLKSVKILIDLIV